MFFAFESFVLMSNLIAHVSLLTAQKSVVSALSACHFLVQSGRIIFLLPQTVQSGSPNEPNLLHPCQSKSRGNRLQYGIPGSNLTAEKWSVLQPLYWPASKCGRQLAGMGFSFARQRRISSSASNFFLCLD